MWGGPADGRNSQVIAAGKTAYAPRGKLQLGSVIKRDLAPAERARLVEHLWRIAYADGRLDPVRAVSKLGFWLTMLVVVLLASSALGLENVREMFSRMLAFIPTLISGTVIVILGMIIGEFVRALIVASAGGVEGVGTVAKLTKGTMVLIAGFMALQQVGVSEEIVTSAFTLILGSIALAAALAFGLGNRQLAGEVTRKWYEEGRRRDRRLNDPPEAVEAVEEEPSTASEPTGGDGR